MQAPKIHLSATETDLMNNAEIILTKNKILQKIRQLLEEVQEQQVSAIRHLPLSSRDEAFNLPPKIAKGENYLGLPYMILDYPRLSQPGNFFFIRTMFWWGNFFSSTLQVSGIKKKEVGEKLRANLPLLKNKEYFLGINSDPWIHHFQPDNYKKISQLSAYEFDEWTESLDHIKIAAKWPLSEWHLAAINLYESWRLLVQITDLVT